MLLTFHKSSFSVLAFFSSENENLKRIFLTENEILQKGNSPKKGKKKIYFFYFGGKVPKRESSPPLQ